MEEDERSCYYYCLGLWKKKNPIMIKNTQKVKATFLLRIKNETSTSTNIVIKVQKDLKEEKPPPLNANFTRL